MFLSEPILHRDQRAITIEIAFRKAHSCYAPSLLFHPTVTADRPHIIGVPMLPAASLVDYQRVQQASLSL